MKVFLLLGIINGFLAVALGAFGAHGLEGKVSEKALATWEKAVNYQKFHALALIAVGILMNTVNTAGVKWAGWLFFIGIILFSGSLYLYSTTAIRSLAMITPFGGVTFLAGWLVLGIVVTKYL